MAKTPDELYKERAKRIEDAIQLKMPDRIPIVPHPGFFPLKYAGITFQEAMYDYNKTYIAWKKTLSDFGWDAYYPPLLLSGYVFEHLDYKALRWPGHGVRPTVPYQFIEPGQVIEGQEIYSPMRAEDYDWFLDDPSDYMIREYLPKIIGALKPLTKLPPIHGVICHYQGLFDALIAAGSPEVLNGLESLSKACAEAVLWFKSFTAFIDEMKKMGFPTFFRNVASVPYDFIANFLRGTRGTMIDMYRNPDKLLKAIEKVTPWQIQAAVDGARATGATRVAIFPHKGFKGMMSDEQYKTFYWPGLKKIILVLIDAGLTPFIFTEGNYTPRLEIIKDVPKGKVIYHIERDIFKAKEVLGNVACLTGGPPSSLLCTSTVEEVKKYCKKLIDVVGKDGGYILNPEVPLIDEKPENVKAMTDYFKEYGVYR